MTTTRARQRDFEGMKERRKRAAKLFSKGASQADIARELEVSRQSVSAWHKAWSSGGIAALNGAGRAGRKPLLDQKDLAKVERALRRGPRATGYATDIWTLPRITEVIATLTGVSYHPGHVWRLMGQLGWRPQRPARRASERDEAAIDEWVKTRWTSVKKTQDAGGHGSPSRTNQASRKPHRSGGPGRPSGQTPVIRTPFNWKRMSMAAALIYAPDGSEAKIMFSAQPGIYNDKSLITFIRQLRRQLSGDKVTLVWDGLPSHRSKRMRTFLDSQRYWLVVEKLPAYAPELNPVEALWGNLKSTELANLCVDTIADTEYFARRGVRRVRGAKRTWRSASCATPVLPYDQSVILLRESQ